MHGMQIHVLKNEAEVSERAADIVQHVVGNSRNPILGLATGRTPLGMYRELIRRYKQRKIDFSQTQTFNLDEYYGLSPEHPQSFYHFMLTSFFNHVNVPEENIHIPLGQPQDVKAYCREYDQRIRQAGGIDLQILGIGVNGHIGFNEPSDELQPGTHVVRLSAETIKANSIYFKDKESVPRYAITMGIHSILQAQRIVLLAIGEDKAKTIARMLHSGITTKIPATFLQLHNQVDMIIDEAAASELVELPSSTSLD